MDKEIDFVARHYCNGTFSEEKAWRRMNLTPRSWWSKGRVAAAVGATVFIGVSAAFIMRQYHAAIIPEIETIAIQQKVSPVEAVKVIDFDNAALAIVVEEIKKVYGIEVVNLPEDADAFRLTLHYEGNVVDLIDRINEVLDINLQLRQ